VWFTGCLTITAVLSSLSLLIFWGGRFNALDEKGLFGLLINIAPMIGWYGFHYPAFEL
jgi:hypothetical protein